MGKGAGGSGKGSAAKSKVKKEPLDKERVRQEDPPPVCAEFPWNLVRSCILAGLAKQ